jgi:hypothetical protein
MKTLGAFVILLNTLSSPSFSETPKVDLGNNSDTSESTYNWTGPYVGGFLAVSNGGNAPNPEFAYNIFNLSDPWSMGFEEKHIYNIYDEDRGAEQYGVISPDSSSDNPFSLGLDLGYNLQLRNLPDWAPNLIGIEGSIGTINLSVFKQLGVPNNTPDAAGIAGDGQIGYTNKIGNYYKFLGGRIGYAFGRSLFYVKGGYMFTKSDITFQMNLIKTNKHKESVEKNPSFGFGFERALENQSGLATSLYFEYMNTDLESTNIIEFNDPVICVPPECYPLINRNNPAGIQFDYQRLQTIKVGMNVRF